MGIDVYMEWDSQNRLEKSAQITGFSVHHGHVGYLREAYHGGPYATHALVPEAFASPSGVAEIPARDMRERLPEVLKIVAERERKIYKSKPTAIKRVQKSFRDFVALAEKQEQFQHGKPVRIIASY